MILLEETTQHKGTYAAVKFDTTTKRTLYNYLKDNDVPHRVRPHEMHTTLLYSRKHCPNYKPQWVYDTPLIANPIGLEVWSARSDVGSSTKYLVLKLDCPELVERHEQLRKEHGATHDYPNYQPHITLSYDIANLDVDSLPNVQDILPELIILGETHEDLKFDWIPRTK